MNDEENLLVDPTEGRIIHWNVMNPVNPIECEWQHTWAPINTATNKIDELTQKINEQDTIIKDLNKRIEELEMLACTGRWKTFIDLQKQFLKK